MFQLTNHLVRRRSFTSTGSRIFDVRIEKTVIADIDVVQLTSGVPLPPPTFQRVQLLQMDSCQSNSLKTSHLLIMLHLLPLKFIKWEKSHLRPLPLSHPPHLFKLFTSVVEDRLYICPRTWLVS